MAVTVASDGTQSATPGTEHTLYAPSTAGMYILIVDVNALSGAEVVELRAKEKALTAGTERVVSLMVFPSGLVEPITRSIPFSWPYGGTFTLTQVGGSSRSFPWSVHKVG